MCVLINFSRSAVISGAKPLFTRSQRLKTMSSHPVAIATLAIIRNNREARCFVYRLSGPSGRHMATFTSRHQNSQFLTKFNDFSSVCRITFLEADSLWLHIKRIESYSVFKYIYVHNCLIPSMRCNLDVPFKKVPERRQCGASSTARCGVIVTDPFFGDLLYTQTHHRITT